MLRDTLYENIRKVVLVATKKEFYLLPHFSNSNMPMCVENLGGKGQGGEEIEYSEILQTFCPENPFLSPME